MESSAAAPRARSLSFPLRERIEPLGVWLFGFLLVALLARNDGGFFPSAWAWAAFSTWLVAAALVAGRPRLGLGALDLTMIAGAPGFAGWFALSALWSRSVPSTSTSPSGTSPMPASSLRHSSSCSAARCRTCWWGDGCDHPALAVRARHPRVPRPARVVRVGSSATASAERSDTGTGSGSSRSSASSSPSVSLPAAGNWRRAPPRGQRCPSSPPRCTSRSAAAPRLALIVGLFAAAFVIDERRLQLRVRERRSRRCLPALGMSARVAGGRAHPPSRVPSYASRGGGRATSSLRRSCFSPAFPPRLPPSSGWANVELRVPPSLQLAWATALIVVVLARDRGPLWAARVGSPAHLAPAGMGQGGRAPPFPQATSNPSGRLLDLSSNGRLGLWARRLWDTFSDHPAVRSGAAAAFWQAVGGEPALTTPLRPRRHGVYAETLAELGTVRAHRCCSSSSCRRSWGRSGARRSPLIPFGIRGLHRLDRPRRGRLGLGAGGRDRAGADLRCGPDRNRTRRPTPVPPLVRGGAVTLAAVLVLLATTSLLASARLDAAQAALRRGDLAGAAADARGARRFAPGRHARSR